MIATMYSVKCKRCGGDSAPIVSGFHTQEEHCEAWKHSAVKTLEQIQGALNFRLQQKIPNDNLPDRLALPALERLEAREHKLEEAFQTIRREILR